jgi:spore germination cell wall hydrolase CwlJ-like protein
MGKSLSDKSYSEKYKKIIITILCFIVCVLFYALHSNIAYAVSNKNTSSNSSTQINKTTLDDKSESSLQDLKREYEQIKEEADSNSGTAKKLASEIREMSLRMADEAKLIEKSHAELDALDTKIEYAQRSLIEYEEDMAVEKEYLYNSIRMEYEDGNRRLLSIFLNVDKYSDIADRLEYSNKISSYINEKMSSYQFMMDMVDETRDSLDELKKQREEELVEYDRKRAKFKQAIDEMSALMKDARKKADNANALAGELETEIARMEAEERMLLMKNGYTDDASSSEVTYSGDGTQYYYKTPYPHTDSELLLLAGIIEAEAGKDHYPGMLAVGSVVMNRVESARFDNTTEGVIYADMQFEPVRTGRLAYILAKGPDNSCLSVAQEVLDGKRNVPNLYFKSEKYAKEHNIEGVNIGGNVFH